MTLDHRRQLGMALRQTRDALGLTTQSFCNQIVQNGGPPLSRRKLWAIERGERAAADVWPWIIETLKKAGAPDGDIAKVTGLLFGEASDGPSALRGLANRMLDLATLGSSSIDYAETVDAAFVRRLADTARATAAALKAAAATLPEPDALDRVTVLQPTDAIQASASAFLEIAVGLRNVGPVPWHDRFLLRLGPPITSTIAYTPPLLAVPSTFAGAMCQLVVPARAHFLPGTCTVTYAMVNARGRPMLPGGLSIRITATGYDHEASVPSEAWRNVLRALMR